MRRFREIWCCRKRARLRLLDDRLALAGLRAAPTRSGITVTRDYGDTSLNSSYDLPLAASDTIHEAILQRVSAQSD
jgi:hypothetical protein